MKTKSGITVLPGGQLEKDYNKEPQKVAVITPDILQMIDEDDYDEDDEYTEEEYEQMLNNNIQYYTEMYKNSMDDVLEFLKDQANEIETESYFILCPDINVLNTLNIIKNPKTVYCKHEATIDMETIEKDINKLKSYITTLKLDDYLYAHVYGNPKKKPTKKTNDMIRKKLKVICPFIHKFREITDFCTDTCDIDFHIFQTEHNNVYKVFFNFKIFDSDVNFYKKFMDPIGNLIRNVNKKHRYFNLCIAKMQNDAFDVYGYDEDSLQTYEVVLSFTLDINDKCKFKPVQRSFEERCVVYMENVDTDDNIDDIDGLSDFLPDNNRLLMKAASAGLRNTKPVPSTGKKVVDFVFGEVKETEDDVIATIECIYDNGDNTTVEVSVYCSFTNLWVQMLKITDGKCDDPKLYDKLLAWYRGED